MTGGALHPESALPAAGSRKIMFLLDQKILRIPILAHLSAMQGAMVLFLFVAMNKRCKQFTMGMFLFMKNIILFFYKSKMKLWVQFLDSRHVLIRY